MANKAAILGARYMLILNWLDISGIPLDGHIELVPKEKLESFVDEVRRICCDDIHLVRTNRNA